MEQDESWDYNVGDVVVYNSVFHTIMERTDNGYVIWKSDKKNEIPKARFEEETLPMDWMMS